MGSLKKNIYFVKVPSVPYDFDFTENIPVPVYRKTKCHFRYDVFRKSKLLFPVCQLFYFRYTVFTRSDHYFRYGEICSQFPVRCAWSHFRYDEIAVLDAFPFPVTHYKSEHQTPLVSQSFKISLTKRTNIEKLI